MAIIGQYKCEIQLNPGPNTLSYRIVVESYHLGSTDSGPNVEQDWTHTYDWNVTASTPESHILRQTDQDLSATNPIDPADHLFFLPDIGVNVLEVTLTPYDAIDGAQGSGTPGDSETLYLGTPASASVMRAENVSGDNIVAPTMKGTGGITMTFANSTIEVDGSGAAGATTLADLTDTTITSPADGQFLRYNSAGSDWLNTLLVAGDIPSLDASKITSGTFADVRIAESNVTQHEAALSVLGIESLTDPNVDRIFFWDDSANAFAFLEVAGGLEIPVAAPTTIQVDVGAGLQLTGGEVATDLSGLGTSAGPMVSGDRFVINDGGVDQQIAPVNIPLSLFTDDLGYSTYSGGDGIAISGGNVISVDRSSGGAGLFATAWDDAGTPVASDAMIFGDGGLTGQAETVLFSSVPLSIFSKGNFVESDDNATVTGAWTFTDEGGILVNNGTGALSLQNSAFHAASLLTAGLKYVSGGGADNSPYDRLNWEYTDAAGGNNNAGSAIIMKGNGSETGLSIEWYTAPTSTGAGANPASLTKRLDITTSAFEYGTSAQFKVTSAGLITAGDGSDSVPAYSFKNDSDTGMYWRTANSIGFSSGGALSFHIDAGSTRVTGTAPQYTWYETDAPTSEKHWRIVASGGTLFFQGREDDGSPFANPTFLRFNRTGTTADNVMFEVDFIPDGNENRDIGSSTARVDDIWASYMYLKRANDRPVIEGIRDDDSIADGDPLFRIFGRGEVSGSTATGGLIEFIATENWTASSAGGSSIAFWTAANGSWNAPVKRVVIDDNGFVGFGTSTPDSPIHIKNSGGADMIRLEDTGGAGSAANPYVEYRDSTATLLGRVGAVGSGDESIVVAAYNGGDIRLAADTGSARTTRLLIDPQDTTSARARFLNTQVYNDEGTQITVTGNVTLDWDEYNQVDILNNGARIVTIDDNSMQDGGHYVLVISYATSGVTGFTWSATGTLQWQGGSAPTLPTATVGDRTVITFVKTGGITLGFYADAPA